MLALACGLFFVAPSLVQHGSPMDHHRHHLHHQLSQQHPHHKPDCLAGCDPQHTVLQAAVRALEEIPEISMSSLSGHGSLLGGSSQGASSYMQGLGAGVGSLSLGPLSSPLHPAGGAGGGLGGPHMDRSPSTLIAARVATKATAALNGHLTSQGLVEPSA